MGWYGRKSKKHCRWCGKQYTAHRPLYKDGFCSPKCKQAHYRAYKNYVTNKTDITGSRQDHRVTHKKPGRKREMIKGQKPICL